jgi:hypothetical protein
VKTPGLLNKPIESYLAQVVITEDYGHLNACSLVLGMCDRNTSHKKIGVSEN